jgi:hypothetical protein
MRSSDFDLYRPLYVTVVYQGKCSHCMRIGVAVPLSGTVAKLREAVSMETKIPTDQVMTLLSPTPVSHESVAGYFFRISYTSLPKI